MVNTSAIESLRGVFEVKRSQNLNKSISLRLNYLNQDPPPNKASRLNPTFSHQFVEKSKMLNLFKSQSRGGSHSVSRASSARFRQEHVHVLLHLFGALSIASFKNTWFEPYLQSSTKASSARTGSRDCHDFYSIGTEVWTHAPVMAAFRQGPSIPLPGEIALRYYRVVRPASRGGG